MPRPNAGSSHRANRLMYALVRLTALLVLLCASKECTEMVSLCTNDHQSYANDGLLTFNTAGLLKDAFQCNCTITFPNSTARDAGFLDIIMLKETVSSSVASKNSSAPFTGTTNNASATLALKKRLNMANAGRELLNIGNSSCSQRPCYINLRRNGSTVISFSTPGGSPGMDSGGMIIVGFRKARTSAEKQQSTNIECTTTLKAAVVTHSQADHRSGHSTEGAWRPGTWDRNSAGVFTSDYANARDSGMIKLITLGTAWGIVVFFLFIIIVVLSWLYHKARKQVAAMGPQPPNATSEGRRYVTTYASEQSLTPPFTAKQYSFCTDTNTKKKANYGSPSRADAFPPPPPPVQGHSLGVGYSCDDSTLPMNMKLQYEREDI